MNRKRYFHFFIHLILIVSFVIIAFPVFYAFIVSTQTFQDVFVYPPKFTPGPDTVQNYVAAWKMVKMGRLLVNSTLISVAVAVGKIILSLMAAFAFTYFRDFKGKGFFFVIILITHMLPLPIRIVPTFELMRSFNWVDTYYALTIPFFASATGVLLFRQLFLTVPASLCDAARVDGITPLGFLMRILIPLSRTNISALFLIEFLYMWNQYLWPLVVTNRDEMRVVQIGLKMLLAGQAQAADWNIIMAGTIIAMLPPLIILFVMQSSLVRGFSMQEEK
jgi:sn-glycerol 3-phosphate transport system permease protein